MLLYLFLFLLFVSPSLYASQASIHHELDVQIKPSQHFIKVDDRITFNNLSLADNHKLRFSLHKNLNVSSATPGVFIRLIETRQFSVPVNIYELQQSKKNKSIQLTYNGHIYHPLADKKVERIQGMRNSAGLINSEGVYLSGSSYWYPSFQSLFEPAFEQTSFDLQVELPDSWLSVSQGELLTSDSDHWQSRIPQNEIYLLAAPFIKYEKKSNTKYRSMVYLRSEDTKLAERYLAATERYIEMYSELLGAYPFKKFALVENFWESGFGMPSFTLLGSRVIRFPFILYSSYPHEIVHNWWGNGVYVDYQQGNWSEGLTAYLADHLLKEQRGKGADYRQQLLQKYTDYVAQGGDFALSDFRGRHSSVTEAVGYGKTLMLFHMLRLKLGDSLFIQGLRELFQQYQFRMASYADVQDVFEKAAEQDLGVFFHQWVKRVGAPKLSVENVELSQKENTYVLKFRIKQNQLESYSLDIPLAITLNGQKNARQISLKLAQKQQNFQLEFNHEPLRIDIDSQFDLFRTLSRDEIPTALTQLFAASKIIVVLPSQEPGKISAYKTFAQNLFKPGQQLEFKLDNAIKIKAFNDSPMVLLGWDNLLISKFPNIQQHRLDKQSAEIQKQNIARKNHSLVITKSNPQQPEQSITWISSDTLASLPGLARKLPHYHKYSYLSFQGDQPSIQIKGRWPVNQSSMTVLFKDVERGELEPLRPLNKSK